MGYIYIYTFSQPTNGSPVVPSKRVPQVMKTPPAWLLCPVASDAASGTSRDAARVPPSNWPPWATESWRSLNGCGISGSQGAGPKMVDKMGEFLGFNPPFYGCFMGFNGWLVIWNMFFPYIGNVIIPTDQYFSEGLKPPTSITGYFFNGFYMNYNSDYKWGDCLYL